MSGLSVSAILSTVRFFADALQARRQQRAAIFEGLVQRNYDAFSGIHRESHSILLPVLTELRHLAVATHQGADVALSLNRLNEVVEDAMQAREQGHPDRSQLYYECAQFERSRLAARRWADPLNAGDVLALRAFIGAICGYFKTADSYNHDLGNALNVVAIATWNWTKRAPSLAEILQVHAEIVQAKRRMSDKWATACMHFGRLRDLIKLNLNVSTDEPSLEALPARANERLAAHANDEIAHLEIFSG